MQYCLDAQSSVALGRFGYSDSSSYSLTVLQICPQVLTGLHGVLLHSYQIGLGYNHFHKWIAQRTIHRPL